MEKRRQIGRGQVDEDSTAGKFMTAGADGSDGARSKPQLLMRKTRSGAFIVRDEGNRRGGCFLTYKAALKFIRDEFGPDAQIVATYVAHKEAA
jgi:hypothetical protein